MADFRLGRLKFKWRGNWSASTAYVIDDIVKYGANSYVCVVNHTSAASETSFYSSDLSNWELHTEGLSQREDWQPGTWYKINDVVRYGNDQYRCVLPHTAIATIQFSNWVPYVSGFNFEDSWSVATSYQKGDIVTYGGYTYTAKGETTGQAPNLFPASWEILTTGFSAQGQFNSNEVYEPGNVVRYGGNTYSCKVTTTPEVHPISSASGDGSIATYVFQINVATAPFGVGDQVVVSACSVGGYNGTFRVVSCSTTQFTVSNVTTGASTGGSTSYVPVPTNTRFWDLIVEGFNWNGQWNSSTVYQLGDVVNRNGNSYICITSNTLGASTAPELDSNGNYWNYLSQGGDAAQVLQETGDLLYQAAGGINRIALPAGSTGTAAEQAEASGKVLTVGGSPLLPRWESNNSTAPVYYVTLEGSDTNNGRSISRAFASVRYACDFIAAKTGADAPSASNPHTIYVKAGVYSETLPIQVPQFVSIIGDNLRTSIIKPDYGNDSDMQAITLASSVSHLKFGDTISNAAGTKTAKVLDSDYATNVHLLDLTGGKWVITDKYIDIVSHTHADAHDLILANREFIASEAYHRHVANDGAVSGTEADVKDRLEEFLDALAFNVKAGQNNKVWEYADALITGTAITGNSTQDTNLLNYIDTVAAQVMRNETVTISSGNTLTQTKDTSITVDSASPYCASVASAITTLVGIVTTAISNGNMSAATKIEPYIVINTATTRVNEQSTMFYVGSHTTIKDLIFEGMTGFIPSGSDDQDMDTATITGVYFRLDPNSPITKSPYIQNCTAIGGAAVGIMIDGAVHAHFDNSATPSYKSMVFDAYTQILDGGVGFYVTRGASSEIVSCFTYYAHISYTSTRGGKIRGVSGNSSYGKYGVISRGFDDTEATINGNVKGLRLEIDPAAAKNGTFQLGERIQGATSGAVGELISDQSASNYLYYFPVTGTFAQGEQVNGLTSTSYITLANNTNAVTGQKGFLLTVEGLGSGPDQGGSVELVDDGINNDSGSYVISNSSYSPPDGRGTLTVSRGRLGSTIASHTGTTQIDLYANETVAGQVPTLQNNILQSATSPLTLTVDTIAGMTQGAFIIINDEMFQIIQFGGPTSLDVTRAVEGTAAQAHGSGDTIIPLANKVTAQDEVIEDFNTNASEIRVEAANVAFAVTDYIKIDNEFFSLNGVVPDTTGITILSLADEKTIGATDGQDLKIRYRYSQCRLTAHDFLDVGTGSKANTNWPFLPFTPNTPANETIEDRPGRVYYVSTDQDGNFSVGKFFKVEQATGKATLDASAFDLAGLSSLRLGSIGAQLGASIDEFSTDGTLSQNSDDKVPTQRAVKTYVDNLSGVLTNFSVGGDLTVTGNVGGVGGSFSGTLSGNGLSVTTNATLGGDIAVNGGDLTTSSETFNLINANATTVNFAGAGTAVTIGATTGTCTIRNANTVISGNLTVNGTTTTLNSTSMQIDDKNIILGTVDTPSNTTADGGGITLEAGSDGDKEIKWNNDQTLKNWELVGGLLKTPGIDLSGMLKETVTINASTLSSDANINVGDSMIHYRTTQEFTTSLPNIRYNATTTLNNAMEIGEVITVTIVTTAGSAGYSSNITIDGIAVTEYWINGSTPSSGGSAGVDIYTFNIIKTANSTWTVIANQTKTS